MKLNFLERMMLVGLLPQSGNILTLKSLRVLREELSPSPEEYAELEIKEDAATGQMFWNPEQGSVEKEFDVPTSLFKIVADKLRDLEKDEELIENQVSLYHKFITGD